MSNEFRQIAVSVDEALSGGFAWVLIEKIDGQWRPLDRANKPLPVYQAAMAAGLLALQALVDDLEAGPRTAPGDEDEAPEEAPQEAPEDLPKRPSLFGFGPAR